MRKFGLIGFPLGHSFSKSYFTEKFRAENLSDCSYENYPIEKITELKPILENEKDLIGLNVTIPYKQQVMELLDHIEDQALEIGAVNTIKVIRDRGKYSMSGYNTDVYGFEQPLMASLKSYHTHALILGTGGASKAVSYILRKHRIRYRFVSRIPKDDSVLSYSDLTPQVIRENLLIINCSPVGMHPNVDHHPDIPYEGVTERHILYDLIYNPEMTEFLKRGSKKKATLINGLPMLRIQAEKAWEIWNS